MRSNESASPFWAPLKPEAGREGADKGGPPECRTFWAPLKPNNWFDLASDDGGRQGEAWGSGPGRRAGRGQIGGGPQRAVQGNDWFDLASDEGGGRGRLGGVGQGGGREGADRAGATREQCRGNPFGLLCRAGIF